MKRSLRKLATKFFNLSVLISDVCLSVYLSLQRVKTVVFYTRGKSVFCAVKFTAPFFLVSYFHGTSKLRKKNGGVNIDGPPQVSMNTPVDHSRNRAFCYGLPIVYKVVQLLFRC